MSSDCDSEPRAYSDPGAGAGPALVEMELDAARVLAGFAHTARAQDQGHVAESHGNVAESSRVEEQGGRKRRRGRCGGSTASSSQGARAALSADEKEAKRIRRILANRESARQTIRRRQERDLVMKEYLSLKERNKLLKEKIANKIRPEIEGGATVASQQMEVSASLPTDLPLVVHCKAPFTPYIWPSFPSDSPNNSPCCQEGNHPKTCGLKKLYYVPPYSWFYPLIHQLSGYCPPYPHVCSDRDEATVNKERDPSTCSEALSDTGKPSLCRESKSEVSLSTTVATDREINVIRPNVKPNSFRTESQMPGAYQDGILFAPSPLKIRTPRPVDGSENVADARERAYKRCIDTILPEKAQGFCIPPNDSLVDTSAAAEARKRRKELTKLKRHLHGRQIRLPR